MSSPEAPDRLAKGLSGEEFLATVDEVGGDAETATSGHVAPMTMESGSNDFSKRRLTIKSATRIRVRPNQGALSPTRGLKRRSMFTVSMKFSQGLR